MSKVAKDSKEIVLAALIIAVLGTSLGAILLLSKKDKGSKSSVSAIGKLMIHMGGMLSTQDINRIPILKNIEKEVNKHKASISDLLKLVSSGLDVWEKIRKGL